MDQWYIARGKTKKGPFSWSQLQRAAAKGTLQEMDLVLRPGTDAWVRANEVDGLFSEPEGQQAFDPPKSRPAPERPARGEKPFDRGEDAAGGVTAENREVPRRKPNMAPSSADPQEASPPAKRSRRLLYVSGAGILGLLVIIAVALLPADSPDAVHEAPEAAPIGGEEAPLADANGAAPGQEAAQAPAVPDRKVGRKRKGAADRRGVADRKGAPDRKGAADLKGEPDRNGADRKAVTVAGPTRSEAPDLHPPAISPSRPPTVDPVDLNFRLARKKYFAAWESARETRVKEVNALNAERKKAEAAAPRNENAPQGRGGAQRGQQKAVAPKPPDPQTQEVMARFWSAVEGAAREFAKAGDEGIAAAQKAGVSEPARLNALRAAQAAGRHANLLGIWNSEPSSTLGSAGRIAAWVIDFDERTGGMQVGAIEWNPGPGVVSGYYRAKNLDIKERRLSFDVVRVPESRRGPTETPASMTFEGDKLRLEVRGVKDPVLLRRTDDQRSRNSLASGLKGSGDTGLDHETAQPAESVAANDANTPWRRVAALSSFGWYKSKANAPLLHEGLYLPYKSMHLSVTPGAYGPLTDMLTGSAPGAGVNRDKTQVLLREYDNLTRAEHPYYRRMAEQGLAICRTRLRLALADEQYGNTPASSIKHFQQGVMLPSFQYSFLREADRIELQNQVDHLYPGRYIVTDAPLSEESRAKLQEFLSGAGTLMKDVEDRGMVSGLLGYADMVQVDRTAGFWQNWLLPLARKAGGPPAGKSLTDVRATWKGVPGKSGAQRISFFGFHNVTGEDLTNAVVELVAENPWGEKAAHYFYFSRLEAGDFASLVPHLRWERRKLDFTSSMTVTWSVWADQGTETGRQTKLTSPKPDPDPEATRNLFRRFDARYQAEGEALGVVVQRLIPLPEIPERAERLFLERTARGMSYLFRVPGEGKASRTLVLRFTSANPDSGKWEAELADPATGQPFRPDRPVWKGERGSGPFPAIAFLNADEKSMGWAFVSTDDRAELFCENAGQPAAVFPTQSLPLFPLKGP